MNKMQRVVNPEEAPASGFGLVQVRTLQPFDVKQVEDLYFLLKSAFPTKIFKLF